MSMSFAIWEKLFVQESKQDRETKETLSLHKNKNKEYVCSAHGSVCAV